MKECPDMLETLIKFQKNDIISIVGSGGKTSLMFHLARLFSERLGHHTPSHKILITTTTKIMLPKKQDYEFIQIGTDNIESFLSSTQKGRFVLGKRVDKTNLSSSEISCLYESKLIGFEPEKLSNYIKYFDLCLIESDGSKGKNLKGWNETEPVIVPETTKTIGVINLKLIGQYPDEQNIFRLEHFKRLLSSPLESVVTASHIKDVILHEKGLFKNAVGYKILFINQADDKIQADFARSLFSGICD